jgi:lipopolysaccharide transport system ATP-binding protein
MSETVIEVENLWKKFRRGERYDSLRDLIPAAARRLVGRGPRTGELEDREFWALRDISFKVRRGEALGIVGPNGSGKSTMLKLLSGILRPNRGSLKVRGRLSALIETGAGFHPDLTGRENVFLNGAILGMTKAELQRKFDEIVAFSGLEQFIDTPVKRYSSGMYARLGFAVAAHVEPEILLVDEVLAVGDAAFQRRCLAKMGETARDGRTVLFVSHNMGAVQELCQRCVLLSYGELKLEGDPKVVVTSYMKEVYGGLQSSFRAADGAAGSEPVTLLEADVLNAGGEPCTELRFGEPFGIRMAWHHEAAMTHAPYMVRVQDMRNRLVFVAKTPGGALGPSVRGRREVVCRFDTNVLVPGTYYVTVRCLDETGGAGKGGPSLSLTILNVPYDSRGVFNVAGDPMVALPASWEERHAP